jgi:hypothetical protein
MIYDLHALASGRYGHAWKVRCKIARAECGISELAAMMIVSGVVLIHGMQKVK